MELAVYDMEGREVDRLVVPSELLDVKVNHQLLHDALVMYLANRRSGTHSTKRRGEVRGGGRKPWPQKGTGRARHGSRRSPIWRHGGVAHGPKPRDYYYRLPKKALRNAFKQALAAKIRDNEVRVVASLTFEEPKTKLMAVLMKRLALDRSVCVCVADSDENAYLSARNLEGVDVVRWTDANTYDLLSHKYLLASREAMESLFDRVCGVKEQQR